MVATYASVLAVCAASLAIGHGILRLCGTRAWSWLSPAVGFAALCSVCWATVRLPGGGTTAAVVVLVLAGIAAFILRGRGSDLAGPARAGAAVALLMLLAASLPFLAEGRFGILGTSFDPDMSQHLLAASRLSDGGGSPLIVQGYPLGPHSIVVALHEGIGVGLVQGFSGLTIAVSVLAGLTALAAFGDLPPLRRTAAAFLVGAPYMVASYFAQGAFKETIEALFLLAFVLGLGGMATAQADRAPRPELYRGHGPGMAASLRAVPLAIIAAGSVYTYSFPGLVWLGGAVAVWGGLELLWALPGSRRVLLSAALAPVGGALLCLLVLTAPEIGRMIDFRSFETFDPSGPGLGNLFGQISPFEGLGIWPSGDFRLTPGDGAVPAAGYYLGVALALALLLYGLHWCRRRREGAPLAGVVAAAAIYAVARVTGTPYQAAKAIELIAPVGALVIVLALTRPGPAGRGAPSRGTGLRAMASAGFAVAAGGCTLLALVNAPVGPTDYSSKLTELRPLTAQRSTLILAPGDLLAQHGVPYLSWELRGGRVCIKAAEMKGSRPPTGVGLVISARAGEPPFAGLRRLRGAGPYLLWAVRRPSRGPSPCPLIAVRSARQGRG